MRFLISVIDNGTNTGSADELREIDTFNDRLVADGHWVLAGGLEPPAAATLIDGRTSSPEVVRGALHDTEWYTSGFWVIDAPDRETALRLAVDGSRACNRRVEVRAFLGG